MGRYGRVQMKYGRKSHGKSLKTARKGRYNDRMYRNSALNGNERRRSEDEQISEDMSK